MNATEPVTRLSSENARLGAKRDSARHPTLERRRHNRFFVKNDWKRGCHSEIP